MIDFSWLGQRAGLRKLGLVLVCLALPADLTGQVASVHGRLLEGTSLRSIPGAAVYLMSTSGGSAGVALSNEQGHFRLGAPAPGSYYLRVERIGYETELTGEFQVPPEGLTGLAVKLEIKPIELDLIEVEAEQVCKVDSESAVELWGVWYEAQKALAATVLSADQLGVTYLVELYERELESSLDIRSDHTDTLAVEGGRAFDFIREEELEEVGWGRFEDGSITRFHGPSPEALLSPWFEATHCFRLVEDDEDHLGEIGLEFDTIEDIMSVGMEGVFWLDPAGWHLRSIDFSYKAPTVLRNAKHQGGTIELDVNPNGSWFVRSWWIRRPVLRAPRNQFMEIIRSRGTSRSRPPTVVGYLERGGRVLDVFPMN